MTKGDYGGKPAVDRLHKKSLRLLSTGRNSGPQTAKGRRIIARLNEKSDYRFIV